MQPDPIPILKRFLRSPALIVAEIAVITLAGVAGTLVSQEVASERVFRSGWFGGTVALAFLSLSIVAYDQIRQVSRSRSLRLAPVGALMIHLGLLLVILAGTVKSLFGAAAVVDLMEGETLPPTSNAWAVQKPGRLVSPLRVAESVTLEAVDARRFKGGDLQNLSARLHLVGSEDAPSRNVDIPVNASVESSGVRLFVGSDYGPAALLEWRGATGATARTAALLKHEQGRRFEGKLAGPDGEQAFLRAKVDPSGQRPSGVELRVMQGPGLLFAGFLPIGQTVTLPSGGSLALHGAPFWVRLHASRDPGLGLIYLGFALLILGVTLRFALHPMFPSFKYSLSWSAPSLIRSDAGRDAGIHLEKIQAVLILLVCVLGLTACSGYSRSDAKQLVERYNTVVSEAYRRGDVKLVDPVVGPKEGKKLTGLIGVRLDMGLTLDSKMLSLEVLEAEKTKDELRVRTRERWSYCDRRIGTGEQVGEKSEDAYEMWYFFKQVERTWLVDRIEFATPPQFGRPPSTWSVDHGRAPGHGALKSGIKKEASVP
jgi:hypothetical protein